MDGPVHAIDAAQAVSHTLCQLHRCTCRRLPSTTCQTSSSCLLCDKLDSIVPTISHPVNLIRGLAIEVCGMKLCKDLLISVILETHDI